MTIHIYFSVSLLIYNQYIFFDCLFVLKIFFFHIVFIFPVFSGCILIKTLINKYGLSLQPC